jgi:hypothetical protein
MPNRAKTEHYRANSKWCEFFSRVTAKTRKNKSHKKDLVTVTQSFMELTEDNIHAIHTR